MNTQTLVDFILGPYVDANNGGGDEPAEIVATLLNEIGQHKGSELQTIDDVTRDLLGWYIEAMIEGGGCYIEERYEVSLILRHLISTGGNVQLCLKELRPFFETPQDMDRETECLNDYIYDANLRPRCLAWSFLTTERPLIFFLVPPTGYEEVTAETCLGYLRWYCDNEINN